MQKEQGGAPGAELILPASVMKEQMLEEAAKVAEMRRRIENRNKKHPETVILISCLVCNRGSGDRVTLYKVGLNNYRCTEHR
jgi:hypothetical protein